MGRSIQQIETPYEALQKHPNYEDAQPNEFDTPISFALRFAANLISPEQEDKESYDIECVDIFKALTCPEIKREITNIWVNYQNKLNKIKY